MRSGARLGGQRTRCGSGGLSLACAVVLLVAVTPVLGAGDPLATANALAQEAERLYAEGRFAEALPKAREALAIREQWLDPGHRDVAESLHNLAELLDLTGDQDAARPLYERSLRIARTALGPTHPDVRIVRRSLLRLLQATGDHAAACAVLEEALADYEEALGPTHLDVADILDGLASARIAAKDYRRASQALERSLRIREQALGPGQLEIADRLENLGRVQFLDGDYGAARRSFERTLTIREREFGPTHPTVVKTLSEIADCLKVTGALGVAKPLYERVLRVQEETLGANHPEVASTVQRLAELHRDAVEYEVAKALYQRALRIREATLGRTHPDSLRTSNDLALVLRRLGDYPATRWLYGSALRVYEEAHRPGALAWEAFRALDGLAGIFTELGDYSQAAATFQEAFRVAEAAPDPNDRLLATTLSNYAMVETYAGNTDAARRALERALALQERTLGPEHPDLAVTLNNLAVVRWKTGDRPGARILFERARAMLEKAGGVGGPAYAPAYAMLLTNLGHIATGTACDPVARPFYLQALQIRERALGSSHPAVAKNLADLACIAWRQGNVEEAAALLQRAVRIVGVRTPYELIGLSHRQKSVFLETTNGFTDLLLSLPRRAVSSGEAYEAVLDRKNVAFRALVQERASRGTGASPEIAALARELVVTRRALATASLEPGRGTRATSTVARDAEIARLHHHLEVVEAQLSSASVDFRRAQTERLAGPAVVCSAVPRDGALIDLFVYDRSTPPSDPERAADLTPHYVAFVLRGGECQAPVRVDLGPVSAIDESVWRFRETVSHEASDPTVRALRGQYRRTVAARLAAKLLPPALRDAISEKPRLLIAPDGVLATLPFALLPGEDGHEFLLETRTISYIPSGRDLLRPRDQASERPNLLAVGAPIFDRLPNEVTQVGNPRTGCGATGERFAPLPGAAAEVQAVAAVFRQAHSSGSTRILEGVRATKATFLEEASKAGILHVATHAFAGREGCAATISLEDTSQETRGDAPVRRGDHPLLLAGIALAGANEGSGAEGILTAMEIASLDLTGTDVVVLSACDTALGVFGPHQEILGLRWAFAYAGAKNEVAALWRVPDEDTATLMTHFYTALWQEKQPVAVALRTAQLAMLQAARASGDAGVHAWGAFTVSGQN